MVVGSIETPTDVVFVVEGTAGCGAYFNDIRQNYVLPTLEHFNGGPLDDKQQDYGVERNGTLFALVIFRSADWLPSNIVDCHGPIQSASRLSKTIDKIEFYGGQAEFHSFIAEGLATAMHCFDDFTELRGPEIVTKKHCVLICNSSPYGLPVTDTPNYEGLHLEQLASMMIERGISLSVMSPRKIPALVSIFDKAGGDCQTMQTKLYAKDPRHLVLLQGYGLQERAATPPPALRENLSLPTAAVAQIPTETTAANLPLGRASPNPMVRPNLPTNIAPTSLPMQRIATPTIPAAVTVSSMPRPGQMQQQAPFGVGTPPNVTLRNTNPAAATGMGTERAPNAVPRWQGPGQTVMTGAANNIGPGINVNVRQTFVSQASVNPAMLNQGMKQTMGMNTGNAGVLNQPNVMQQQQQQQQQQQIQNQQIQAQVQAQVQAQRLQNQQQQQQLQAQQAALAQAQLQRLGGLDNQAQQVQQQASVPNQNLAAQQQQQPQPNVQAAANLQNIPTNVNNAQMGAQMQPGMANVNNLNPQVVQNQQLGNVMMGNVMQTPGGAAPPNLINPANQAQQQQQGQAPLPSRERVSIWQGILEWQEKPRELQKPARQVQCQVSAAVVQPGEAEVKAENWPPKLIMQLIPKQLISTFGGAYLKNARSVLFHPTNCEALEALSKVMASGYAGCVHFTTPPNRQPCEIKVLMLLYSPEKRAYVGFIPNDQAGFVERIKSVIQQQKNKQGQMAGPMMGPGGQPAQGVNPSFIAAQQAGAGAGPNTQAGFLLTQSNISAMVGGQISAAAPMVSAQQVNVPSSQPTTTQATVGLLGNPNLQHAAGAGTPGIRQMGAMPEMNAGAVNVSNANNASNVGTAAPGAGISQMEAERQQNLLKIQQLQQTLQAAQQKELQFKAQQQQFRQMDIQQLQNRHMRPGAPGTAAQMQANPGLRHLLQQQQQAAQQQGQVGFRPQGLILQQGNRMQQPGMPQQQQQQAQQQQQSQQQQQGQGHFNNLGLLDLI